MHGLKSIEEGNMRAAGRQSRAGGLVRPLAQLPLNGFGQKNLEVVDRRHSEYSDSLDIVQQLTRCLLP